MQYSWITGAFQIMIMQPICGYVLDVVGAQDQFAILP
jgi:hypothetical protein